MRSIAVVLADGALLALSALARGAPPATARRRSRPCWPSPRIRRPACRARASGGRAPRTAPLRRSAALDRVRRRGPPAARQPGAVAAGRGRRGSDARRRHADLRRHRSRSRIGGSTSPSSAGRSTADPGLGRYEIVEPPLSVDRDRLGLRRRADNSAGAVLRGRAGPRPGSRWSRSAWRWAGSPSGPARHPLYELETGKVSEADFLERAGRRAGAATSATAPRCIASASSTSRRWSPN